MGDQSDNMLNVNSMLYLRLTSTSGVVEIDNPIPQQTLILKQYNVSFNTTGASQTNDVLYLDIQPLSAANINTNSPYKGAIPLLVESGRRQTNNQLEIPLYTDRDVKKSFEYRIYGPNGSTTITDFKAVNLLISYDNGVIYR